MLCQSICAVVVQDMEPSEIGSILRHPAMGRTVQDCLHSFPALSLEAQLQPITRCASTLSNAWRHGHATDFSFFGMLDCATGISRASGMVM